MMPTISTRIRPFFHKIGESFAVLFSGYNLRWQGAAILLTYALAASGFDWFYYLHTRSPVVFALFIPAAILGFLVPVLAPLILLFLGTRRNDKTLLNSGYALGQSAAIAWVVSSAYKALTGRVHPVMVQDATNTLSDISRVFRLGFFRGGIFWGWPSSHAAVAFAIAATAIILFPNLKMKIAALLFAFYVGIGVSLTIHWFSDFAAGAIFGTVAGIVVGKSFRDLSKLKTGGV